MKRLTFKGNFCDIAKCQETPGGSFCENGMCSQRKVWERLKYYEDTEEQGRLVVLPCKVGTPVYFIAFDKCWGGKCCWLKDGKCIKENSPEYCPKEVLETKYSLYMYLDGTRVFLTREEAENALKGGAE